MPASKATGIVGRPFQKGQSGNLSGRPKGDVQWLARTHTAEAIETLVLAMQSPRERVPAAVALLDRGWGRPAQAITGPDGSALRHIIEVVTGVPRADEDVLDDDD